MNVIWVTGGRSWSGKFHAFKNKNPNRLLGTFALCNYQFGHFLAYKAESLPDSECCQNCLKILRSKNAKRTKTS